MGVLRVQNVYEIFEKRTNIDFEKNEDLRKEKFFGFKLHINPRDLVMVYMDLKIIAGIDFKENDLVSKKFDSFDNVMDILEKVCGYSIRKDK